MIDLAAQNITITNGAGDKNVTLVENQWYQAVYDTAPGYDTTGVYKKTNGTFELKTDGKFQADLTGDEAAELALGIKGAGSLKITIAAPIGVAIPPVLTGIKMRRTDGNTASQQYFYGDLKTNAAGEIQFDGLPVGVDTETETYPTVYIKIDGLPFGYILPTSITGNTKASITNNILSYQLETTATAQAPETLTITLILNSLDIPTGLYNFDYPKYDGFEATTSDGYYGVENGTLTIDETTQP